MKKSKAYNYLGLARRAGKVLSGYQTCLHTLGKSPVYLVIVASDASQNTKDKFSSLCERHDISFKIFGTATELSEATGLPDRGIFAITDQNLAEAMIKEIEHE
jgi:ribosomal protein L7Ae-like RNA K-turn-binding protein